MTREEAGAVLGVTEGATVGDVRKRYEALHTDFQIRLTNAPTSALKKTYQQKLQEVLEASELLAPGISTGQQGGDLPSAEPVLDAGGRARPQASSTRPTARPLAPAQDAGFPRSTIIAGVLAVVFASALSFVALRWFQASTRVAQLEAEQARLIDAGSGLEARVKSQESLLFNDRLRVRNLSQNTVKLSTVALIYRDSTGALKVAHSGNYDYPTWDIRPGTTVQLDPEMARGRLWDGPVIYYSFLIEYPGVEPFLKTGIWAEDIDRLDKVVSLDLD